MKKRDVLDIMVILTGMAFFVMLILTIGGHFEYLPYVAADFACCMIFMKWAHEAHHKYSKGYINRTLREREREIKAKSF